MVIKVLFFDTDALLKKFINEEGSDVVKWITSPRTKVGHALHFVINNQVCDEFERKIRNFSKSGKISEESANRILRQFSRNRKDSNFRVISQELISNIRNELTLDEIIKEFELTKGKNDWDALHYQSIVNSLAYLGGESHPILVTCDKKFGNKVNKKGYRVINPMKQSLGDIQSMLA